MKTTGLTRGEDPKQPRRGWPAALKGFLEAGRNFNDHNGPHWAAAIAYYALLSVFPLLLAVVSVGAFFVDPGQVISQIMRLLSNYIPEGANQIETVIQEVYQARGAASALSIAALLWSGSRVFSSVTVALNKAFQVAGSKSFLKRSALELSMALTVGVLFILALASRFGLSLIESRVGTYLFGGEVVFGVLQEGLMAVLLVLAFYLTYWRVPHTRVSRQAALLGALIATLLFSLARPLFEFYVNRFANYNLVYGSLAIVAILIFWTWLTAAILLFGGEVVAHFQGLFLEAPAPGPDQASIPEES